MFANPLLKGCYTGTGCHSETFLGAVRYLNTRTGELYEDADGKIYANSGFRAAGEGRWTNGVWVFTADKVAEPGAPILGYAVSSSNGAPTVLHRTQKIAEAEALRLAQGNTGVEFTVFPVYCGAAVAKAHTPKPVAKLERL